MTSAADLDFKYPALCDLRARAKQRMPRFAFEYVASGTGSELGMSTNRSGLDAVKFLPAILRGPQAPDLRTTILGQPFNQPFGVAPVGMSGMIWPGAEKTLAAKAQEHGFPYCLSTVAATTPEAIGPIAGDKGWFQLYAPLDPDVLRDMLRRIKTAGFSTLILTVDVPGDSRRERQRRAQLRLPPTMTPSFLWSALWKPSWALETLRNGVPRMAFPESYVDPSLERADAFVHAGRLIRGYPDWDYLARVRDLWDGPLIIKGVEDPKDVQPLIKAGVDALWVSNHSARQFDAGPASIDCLPAIRAAAGPQVPIIFDSGIESGLDILRALTLGADFCMLGRAWHYALGALGARGVDHLVHILKADMVANMAQIGAASFADLPKALIRPV